MTIQTMLSRFLFIASASIAFAQTSDLAITIPVTDTTVSPLVSFSGSVEFRKSTAPLPGPVKDVTYQNGTVIITNKSDKDILALVASIRVLAPEGVEEPILYRHDYFFKPHSFPPNGINELPLSGGFGLDVPQQQNKQPYVKAELHFVQFADGTSWGDSSAAADLFSQRKDVEKYITNLKTIYESQGTDAFLKALALKQQPLTSVSAVWRHLNMLNEQSGPDAVYQDIKDRLTISIERRARGFTE